MRRRCFLTILATFASLSASLAASALGAQAPAAIAPPATPERLVNERKFEEARAMLNAQLAANKKDGKALYWMGRSYYHQDKFDDAIDWFEKAVDVDANNAVYHLWLGNAVGDKAQNASKLKQPFLAKRIKAEFEKAVALDPKLVDAREGLVGFYTQAPGFMGGSIDKAKEQAAEIVKLDPVRGQYQLARIARNQKDLAGEEAAYKAAVAAAPDSAGPKFNLAGFFRRNSRWDDAFALYEAMMKNKETEVVAHLGWGGTAAQSGKSLDRGEREIKQFLAAGTIEKHGIANMAGAHYRLGTIYERTARKDLAKAEYQECLKINPQHPDAKKALDALK